MAASKAHKIEISRLNTISDVVIAMMSGMSIHHDTKDTCACPLSNNKDLDDGISY